MLQTVCMSPELLVHPTMSENEICGYSPGQGSPLPGETASPKSCFQQSPSLPDSGLTELNVASPKIYHPPPPPCKPPGMPAPAGKRKKSLFPFPIRCSLHQLVQPSELGLWAAQTKLDNARDVQHVPLLSLGWILLCPAAEVRNCSAFHRMPNIPSFLSIPSFSLLICILNRRFGSELTARW